MDKKPEFIKCTGGVYWEHTYSDFKVKVYTPDCDPIYDIINRGFLTPYVMVLEEKPMTIEEDILFAREQELTDAIKEYGGSIAFFSPLCKSWKEAPADLFVKFIDESRIGEYYENGCLNAFNRIKKVDAQYYIRGAVHRSFLYGVGEAADYIALNCLKKFDGNFLWGPGEITPVVCTMKNASVLPVVERNDIVVVSSGNSAEFNNVLKESVKNLLIDDEGTFGAQLRRYTRYFIRILGNLEKEKDPVEEGMVREFGFELIETSSENIDVAKDVKERNVGYVMYCNRDVLNECGYRESEKCADTKAAGSAAFTKTLPTVIANHGGGDAAMIIAEFQGWAYAAQKYGFLLICVENHLHVTATETVGLVEKLKGKYPIDPERIYVTGFSMGGIKSWDCYQEYPQYFAAAAPTSATTEPGVNVQFQKSPKLNDSICLPVFYVGGEKSPLPEIALQHERCLERMRYVLKTNGALKKENVVYNDKSTWEDPRWAVKGDYEVSLPSWEKEGRVMTLELFESEGGKVYSVFGSINDQQHELHQHQCEVAYRYMSCFRRLADGTVEGGDTKQIIKALERH